jgi:pre-mRNA-processing factor 40
MSAWKVARTADGKPYYYHTETKKTQWEKPDDFIEEPPTPATPATPQNDAAVDGAWREAVHQDGRTYYYNSLTKETTWKVPPAYLKHQQNSRQAAPAFVAGGGQNHSSDDYGSHDRRLDRRGDRDHGLPQKPSFDGGRGGGMPWEQRQDNMGFRGAMPVKTDEPDYATYEQAEEAFSKMLRKNNISPDTSWEEALRTVIKEREYRAFKDPKERKQAFEKYCVEVRAQEKGREKERKEKLREDFRKMLGTHDDIKHYTRWKTARPLIEREAVFKSAGDDDERRQIFDEYIIELKRKHVEDEIATRNNALQDLDGMLQALIIDPDTKWADARERIMESERFRSDPKFQLLSLVDVLNAFDGHMKSLDRVANEERQEQKRLRSRRQRQARDSYKQLLQEMIKQGKLTTGTKWKDLYPFIENDERYLNVLGLPGSTPVQLFWDTIEDEIHRNRHIRNTAMDVLDDKRYEMTTETSLDDLTSVMRSDPRTAHLEGNQMKMIYDKLMEKIRRRAEQEREESDRQLRKAIDALRSAIKHMTPPVRVDDRYEDVLPKLQALREFRGLDEESRRAAFDKHVRRLKEKDDGDRTHRDRDRDPRNGSRRDNERDADRRRDNRTPEQNSYEEDRKRAQADRERQYRKASFGLSPPRDRRDDRDDRQRRHRRDDSIYERERREREMERERSYISRADPRDKGRALDYGDEDVAGSRPGSIRKRRDSDVSTGGRRDPKVRRLR